MGKKKRIGKECKGSIGVCLNRSSVRCKNAGISLRVGTIKGFFARAPTY